MMRFDYGRFSAKSAFYNVRINCSLCQEVNGSDFLCFFLKDTDKFFTDNFSFLLRLCNSCKLVIITLLCIYSYKV